MTHTEMMIKEQATKEMNRRFPQEELAYRNGIVATIIALDMKERLTKDWLMKALLTDVEDGFMTYEQAVAIAKTYFEAIKEVERMF